MLKIISGLNCGADISALRAAKRLGLETGGWIPKEFKTKEGQRPEYKNLYNAIETEGFDYKTRTWKNVENSHCTLRVAKDFNTPGEICTLNALRAFGTPYMDIPVTYGHGEEFIPGIVSFLKTIRKQWPERPVMTVNCAGNALKSIEWWCEELFYRTFGTYIRESVEKP